ncbi:MAG: hypothetical protein KDA41_05310, partial [Planctomycetales bacterium]|nr:hypothetical protein [Planctomycetales bacterium]
MADRDMEIVPSLRRAVADLVGADDYALWLAGGQAISLDGDTLCVSASSQFKLERVRSNFRESIERAAQNVLGRVPPLRFQVAPTLTAADAAAPTGAAQTAEAPAAPSLTTNDRSRRRFASLRTFIAADTNRVAFTSCEMVVDRPGEITPLFLYGPSGCGKSHLLEGVWSAVRQRRRQHALYLSAEQFTSYFLEALKGSGLPNFRRKYRGADVLLLDDVQFFIGKKATITELQHTADEMLRAGRQLVLAADRPPSMLTGLGDALTARLSSGMVCAMQPHDRATRLAIARQMATARRLELPRNVLE